MKRGTEHWATGLAEANAREIERAADAAARSIEHKPSPTFPRLRRCAGKFGEGAAAQSVKTMLEDGLGISLRDEPAKHVCEGLGGMFFVNPSQGARAE